ncbi:DUF2141 domain-containing protein [Mucilaginibacter paludis]|uniref:DUF2141 domain-containing protein n=1 Tax=Mucilaginibacter paludis DSM 18603 TaxID=714943 RepID=H1YD45_9SPHI|nr:DUF2141 domain-containing protein [Mucilaginibacter paludis]EHQ26102.1 Protein of unknown function DUF2141 [Mucilaginibacter paludis DSM 18603]
MKKITVSSINPFIGLLLIFFGSSIQAQELPVKVIGIRSLKGNIIINVFKDQTSYDDEKPFKQFKFDKKPMDKGTMTLKLALEPGTYGITLLDDENSNGKIDKNLIRIPKEGFGFSNFFMTKMKKPAFEDFKIDLKAHPVVEIKVKYM